MINEAIRAVIDLLRLRKDAKKTDLEIDKLDREKKKEQSVLHIATLDDVKKYDPKARKIEQIARAQTRDSEHFGRTSPRMASSGHGGLWWAVIAILVSYILYRVLS